MTRRECSLGQGVTSNGPSASLLKFLSYSTTTVNHGERMGLDGCSPIPVDFPLLLVANPVEHLVSP